MSKPYLEAAMLDVLHKIEQEMEVLEREAQRLNIDVTSMRSTTGDYIIIPLLVARANVLTSLAFLEERTVVEPEVSSVVEQTQGRVVLVTRENQEWAAQTVRQPLWRVQELYKESARKGIVCVIPIPND